MRILILTQYYDPEPEPFPGQLAKGLVERGHSVMVMTGFPNYPYGEIFSGYRQRFWQWEERDKVKILRLPLYPDRSLSLIRRSMYYVSMALSSSIIGAPLCGNPDIIFIYHPISLCLPAWWIGLLKKIPFVINIQDMYPESLSATKIANQRTIINMVGKFCKFMYKRASAIAVISQGFKQNLVDKGVAADKIHVIYNWADEGTYRPVPYDQAVANEFQMTGRFNVVYAGSMGPPQGLQSVLEAARLLSDLPQVQFIFVGDGLERNTLASIAEEHGLTNVRFFARQPALRMPGIYSVADVLLVHLIDDPLFAITIPSKTQSYLACGKPLLMSLKGDATRIVLGAGAGVAAKPSEPADLARCVRTLYSMSPEARQSMGNAGREYFLRNFTLEVCLKKYEELFDNLCRAK